VEGSSGPILFSNSGSCIKLLVHLCRVHGSVSPVRTHTKLVDFTVAFVPGTRCPTCGLGRRLARFHDRARPTLARCEAAQHRGAGTLN
jgi:hypothetical protein